MAAAATDHGASSCEGGSPPPPTPSSSSIIGKEHRLFLELVGSTRYSISLSWAWAPHSHAGRPAVGKFASMASLESTATSSPGGAATRGPSMESQTGVGVTPSAAQGQSQVAEGENSASGASASGAEDRDRDRPEPDYRLQMKERTKPWQTVYWGFKTRVTLDSMPAGDCLQFRVQREHGPWSDTLVATTKDDLVPMATLHRAITQGLPHRARKFLSQRPLAVDVPDRAGRSALLLAVLRLLRGGGGAGGGGGADAEGEAELVHLLLNAGADPNHGAEGLANRTPLMLAALTGRASVCRALRDRGACWDIPDRNGCTALHYAASGGCEEVVRVALEDGADVTATDTYGWTPLMKAVLLGAGLPVISLLLEAGNARWRDSGGGGAGGGGGKASAGGPANPVLQQDAHGHTALHLAALCGRQDAAALLARFGGDLRAKSRHGRAARELGRCWPISQAEGAHKGGVDATLAVATAASAMLKTRFTRRKQDELDLEDDFVNSC